MLLHLVLAALTLALHYAAYQLYTRKSVPAEVAQNAEAIRANGSQDNLRKGFHQRETWSRVWPWLGCAVVPNLPALYLGWLPALLGFVGLAVLLWAYFARYFTPLLNVARGLPYDHASSDSASWPDAAVWKKVRQSVVGPDSFKQVYADQLLQRTLTRTWLIGRILYFAASATYVAVAAGRLLK